MLTEVLALVAQEAGAAVTLHPVLVETGSLAPVPVVAVLVVLLNHMLPPVARVAVAW